MPKSLDGIKKLNPDEIKKYRKTVLDYIGEKDSSPVLEKKDSSQEALSLRRVDGINLNKVIRSAPAGKIKPNKLFTPKDEPAAEPIKPVSPPASPSEGERSELMSLLSGKKEKLVPRFAGRAREAERLKEAVKRQEEEREKIEEEERQYRLKKEQAVEAKKWEEKMKLAELEKEEKRKAKENIRLEKERIKQEKIRQAEIEKQKLDLAERKIREQRELIRQEELKKKEMAEQAKRRVEEKRREEEAKEHKEKMRLAELKSEENRRVKESLLLEKMKRREEKEKAKQEIKIAKQAARARKKIKRQKAWRKFRKNINFKLDGFFSGVKRNIFYIASLLILFLAIAYLLFCLAVLRLKIDNNFTDYAAEFLPVPAVITNQGVISYLDYKKIDDKNYSSLNLAGEKNYLARWLILRGLKEKYGLPVNAAYDDLAIKYVLDKDFNQIGLSRINKINQLLKGGGGIEPFGKYADEYNSGTYYGIKSAVEKFGSAVSELAVGQASSIISRADGYYLVERIDDKKSQLGLKYLFVGARTLDQYVSGSLERMKMFILAN